MTKQGYIHRARLFALLFLMLPLAMSQPASATGLRTAAALRQPPLLTALRATRTAQLGAEWSRKNRFIEAFDRPRCERTARSDFTCIVFERGLNYEIGEVGRDEDELMLEHIAQLNPGGRCVLLIRPELHWRDWYCPRP